MTKMPTMRGEAVTLEWPERGVALATMTRAEEMNTLSLELLDELGEVAGLTRQERARGWVTSSSQDCSGPPCFARRSWRRFLPT